MTKDFENALGGDGYKYSDKYSADFGKATNRGVRIEFP
jgi:hypothetical protein